MALPILGIDFGQSRIRDHQQILTVLLFRGNSPMIGPGDHDRSIQDHDFIVRPCTLCIEGDRDPRRYQVFDSRDRGMMRLRMRIEEDLGIEAVYAGKSVLGRK